MAFTATKKIQGHSLSTSSGKVYAGRNLADHWFEVTIADVSRVVSGSTSEVTVQDRVMIQTSGDKTYKDRQLTPVNIYGIQTFSYSSSNTAVADVNSAGYVTQKVDAGSCTITVTGHHAEGAFSQSVPLTFSYTGSGTTQTYSHPVSGTLRAHIENSVATRLASTRDKIIYTARDPYTRNGNCWAATLADLTPIITGSGMKACLITPQDILGATHAGGGSVGDTVKWTKADGTVVTRTIASAPVQVAGTDILVTHLNAPITLASDGVDFARVLPDNYQNYISDKGLGLPALIEDQEDKALIQEVISVDSNGHYASHRIPLNTLYTPYTEVMIGGDSGSGGYLLINNKLVVTEGHHYAANGPASGPSIVYYKSAINTALASLGSSYTLTAIDLSGFTSLV